MVINKFVGGYKVETFPWVDKELIYFNVQYFKPGQSLSRPPAWDKTVYFIDTDKNRQFIKDFLDSIIEYVSKTNFPDNAAKIILSLAD